MDDMEKSIEKLIKAGIDAVSEGLNITREAVNKIAGKGELLDQARSSVSETAEKLRDTVVNNIELRQAVDDAKRSLLRLNKEQLLEVQGFIARLIEAIDKNCTKKPCADKPCVDQLCADEPCVDEPCADDKAPDPGPADDLNPESAPGPGPTATTARWSRTFPKTVRAPMTSRTADGTQVFPTTQSGGLPRRCPG